MRPQFRSFCLCLFVCTTAAFAAPRFVSAQAPPWTQFRTSPSARSPQLRGDDRSEPQVVDDPVPIPRLGPDSPDWPSTELTLPSPPEIVSASDADEAKTTRARTRAHPSAHGLTLEIGNNVFDPDGPITLPDDEVPTEDSVLEQGEGKDLLLQSARNAVRLKRYDLAISRFTEHLRLHPHDHEARLELAIVLSDAGQEQAASMQAEHLLQQFPDNPGFLRRYADMQIQLSSFSKAEVALKRLMDIAEYRIEAAIDLARVYAWTDRTDQAVLVYDQVLRNVALDDSKRQLQFARMLSDIRRPREALELLQQLHDAEPLDIDILQLIVLSSARSNDPNRTLDYVGKLQPLEPENVDIRLDLAQQLFEESFFREAIAVDQQVLAFDASNVAALSRLALAHLRLYEAAAAKSILAGMQQFRSEPRFLRALAEYHSVVGEHGSALAVCRQVLELTPDDLETRIFLGHALNRSGQLIRAASEFAKVVYLASQPGVRNSARLIVQAQLAQARSLAEARRFGDALGALSASEREGSDAYVDTTIDVLAMARLYPAAIDLVRAELTEALGQSRRETQLRAKLGLLLARNGQYSAALQELSVVGSGGEHPIPEVVYGMYQSHVALGHHQIAQQVLSSAFGLLTSDTHLRVRVAELATEDCDCCLAWKLLAHLDRFCTGNAIISNRLGEACFQCAACEQTCDCSTFFLKTLRCSPGNVQALLGLARIHARLGHFDHAHAFYQRAIRHMPDDANLWREVARMVRDWKGPNASVSYHQRAGQLTRGDQLFVAAARQPERTAELELEYEGLARLNSIVHNEMQAKASSGWLPLSAITAFGDGLAMEPDNEDAAFELGQAFSQLNRTHCAIEQYEKLLCINPCHREAKVAIARNCAEMRPQVHFFGSHREQSGRSDLAASDRTGIGGILQLPLGEEDEFIHFGYERVRIDPPGGPLLDGDIATARIQWKPDWPLLIFGEIDYETYEYGFQPRATYDVGARYRYVENAVLRVHGLSQNVYDNHASILSDIHRYGGEIGNSWQPCFPVEIDTFYRYWEYSDDNAAHEAGIRTGIKLTHGRRQLRWLTDFDYLSYREPGVFLIPGDLFSATHPYFAPRDFWYVSGGLEFRRYFGCATFKAASVHWVELYGGARIDSEGFGYGLARGQIVRDYQHWLSVAAYFDVVHSSAYNSGVAGGRVTIRF